MQAKQSNANGPMFDAVAVGNLPVNLLTAQTAVNSDTAAHILAASVDLGVCRKDHTLQVNAATGVTGGVVKIYTSLDGLNWIASAASITTNAAGGFQAVLAATPARWVAAVITTIISGGGAPAVDAWIGSC